MNLVLDMLSLKSHGDLKIEMTYSLQPKGEVWARDMSINQAMSECAIREVVYTVLKKQTNKRGRST